jgi:hypothetical protein
MRLRISGVFKPQKIPDNACGISGMTEHGSSELASLFTRPKSAWALF